MDNRVLFYLRCTTCRHEYKSYRSAKLCPRCWAPGKVYGIKEDPFMDDEGDTGQFAQMLLR